ncbi:MAG: phosphoribosylformylglycinamidine synthase II, partial [Acidobacteria bacterium]
PTPVIGVVGLLEHVDRLLTRRFQVSGAVIVLLGDGRGELGGSEFLSIAYQLVRGVPPSLDLGAERALQNLLVSLSTHRLIGSAHDCSEGGVAVTLAESCFGTGGVGAEVSLDAVDVSRDDWLNVVAALFGESASRVVVSVTPDALTEVLQRAAIARVPARVIGETGGNRLRMAVGGRPVVDLSVDEAERVWSTAIERVMVRRVA